MILMYASIFHEEALMITVNYSKPFTNNIEKDVKNVQDSYLADLERLRSYYGMLFVQAAHNSTRQPNIRRMVK